MHFICLIFNSLNLKKEKKNKNKINILKSEHKKCTKLNCNSQGILIYVSAGQNLIRLEHVFLKEIHLRVFPNK